jgi:LAO/AO transport system kinase
MAKQLSTEDYIKGLQSGDRAILSKAITLAESELPGHNALARELLEKVMPATGNSLRIAITGVPGAGKSTFIEVFGKSLTSQGKKVAVLAVDPTSSRTKGSIMGDKTRMEELSRDPNAFIRPSPSGKSLGGITRRTRESILLCEAAGFDIILVETVGVGQVETSVHNMVDFFMLILLTGAGDELQVLKKGVIELADMIIINKADGANAAKAKMTQAEIEKVLDIFPVPESGWKTSLLTASALEHKGIREAWQQILDYTAKVKNNGYFTENRKQQNIKWMREAILELLEESFYTSLKGKDQKEQVEKEVAEGKIPPLNGALKLFKIFKTGS